MKKIIILLALLISCTPKKLIPAKILGKVMYVGDISIIVNVVDVIRPGHFMHELNIGDQLEIFIYQSYADSAHLMNLNKEFLIKNEHGYWEMDD